MYLALISYDTTDPIPSNLKMGFGASTGGGVNYHEIRNLLITTTGGVRVHKEVDKVNAMPGDELTYTINVHNETRDIVSNLIVNDDMKDEDDNIVSLTDGFEISSITFNNNGRTANTASGYTSGVAKTTGFTNPFSTTMTLDPTSLATFTIVGKVKDNLAGKVLKNSVGLDVSGIGITDPDLTNNFSTVSTTILNPKVDLKIEKGVNNNGIAQSSGNTYTIVVSNVSSIDKPNNKQVIVEDIIPAELTVTSASGIGWSKTGSGNNLTFTRSDLLKAQFAYPPITINVTPTGTGPWTNTANLTYTDDTNLDNNSSSVNLRWVNYWRGTIDTDWAKTGNWTANYVPTSGQDIEFATADNNSVSIMGLSGPGAGKGEAKNDLHLDKDRIIGDLINKSDKSLIVTTNNKLVINGVATDSNDNPNKIVVKASENEATGTLIFKNPDKNKDVQATVEFYNQAYDCKDCGYFTRSWQYFGIPVSESGFPYLSPQMETINEWMENANGNKWVNRAITDKLQAFKGYEITNSSKVKPENIYQFKGKLNVGDATVGLTKTTTPAVNYSGMNLVANSFTAAIPIDADAIKYSATDWNGQVYLFNTGTRDEWRKLNGGSVPNVVAGTYTSVPTNVAGEAGLPTSIPSMHTFMVNALSKGNMSLKYSTLVKNEVKDGQPAWRSAEQNDKQEIPHIVLDVIGTQSADRVWLFEQHGTTRGFDNGWDGVKMPETDIVQLYVAGEDAKENYQVATVPQLVGTSFGMKPENNDGYTLSVAVSQDVAARGLYLRDMLTGRSYALKNGAEYRVSGATSSDNRFKVVDTTLDETKLGDNPLIDIYVVDSQVVVANNSDEDCTVTLYDVAGKLVAKKSSARNSTVYMSGAGRVAGGVYLVKVAGTQQVNETKRVMVK